MDWIWVMGIPVASQLDVYYTVIRQQHLLLHYGRPAAHPVRGVVSPDPIKQHQLHLRTDRRTFDGEQPDDSIYCCAHMKGGTARVNTFGHPAAHHLRNAD